MLRPITPQDSEELAALSVNTFAHYDIMYKLGRGYLSQVFFPAACACPGALGMLYEGEQKVQGYCLAFNDFAAFQSFAKRRYLRASVYHTLRGLALGRLTLVDVLNVFQHGKVIAHAGGLPHVGPLAVDESIKSSAEGGWVILRLLRAVLWRLHDGGAPACWGIADTRNTTSMRLMEACGFEPGAVIPLLGRQDRIYFYHFRKDNADARERL